MKPVDRPTCQWCRQPARGHWTWWNNRPQCADTIRCFDRAYKQATRKAGR
ncbi:hypothetical protein [Streptomyces antibioticus]